MVFRREHARDPAARSVGLEQEPARCRGEARTREVAPAVPSGIIGVGRRSARDADILEPFRGVVVVLAHAARSAISFLVSAIAFAGLRPLGQTFAQFMIVWQR